ncbi:MAG: hypothetical protein ABEI80_04290 [Haloplanus sp.]
MNDGRGLDERVDAVERAVTDGHAAEGLPDAARMEERLADLETAVDDIDDRLAELEAAVQALRGFAGGIQAVDESVERRANAAIARVERLETELRERGGGAGDEPEREVAEGEDADPPSDGSGDTGRNERHGDDTPPNAAMDATLAEAAAATARTELESADRSGTVADSTGEDPTLADRLRRLL